MKISERNYYIDRFVNKYDEVCFLLKKLISAYSKYGDCNRFYSYLHDELDLKQSDLRVLVNYVKTFFYQSLCSGSNIVDIDVLDRFSFDDILLFEKIESRYNHIFDQYTLFFSEDISSDISEYNKLFSLFDEINGFLDKNSMEFCVGHVCNDLKISLREIEDVYQNIFKSYCTLKIKKGESIVHSDLNKLIERDFKYSDISNFCDFMNLYRELTCRAGFLIDYLVSGKEDVNKFVRMMFQVRYFNDIIPSVNQHVLLSKMKLLENDYDRKKIVKFIVGYRTYFSEQRRILDNDRRREILDKELNDIDLYASVVRSFLDSKYELLDDYFDACDVDRKKFEKSLKIIKKYDHPCYHKYMQYVECLRRKNVSNLLIDARRIISLMKNGIELDSGQKRDFDLVDYYCCTSLNKRDFLNIIRGKVSSNDYALVSKFLSRYRYDKFISGNGINELYDTNVSFPCEFDSEGNIVSTYTVTKEDKQDAIICLKNKGVPLTRTTFSILLRRNVMERINSDNFQKINIIKKDKQ